MWWGKSKKWTQREYALELAPLMKARNKAEDVSEAQGAEWRHRDKQPRDPGHPGTVFQEEPRGKTDNPGSRAQIRRQLQLFKNIPPRRLLKIQSSFFGLLKSTHRSFFILRFHG